MPGNPSLSVVIEIGGYLADRPNAKRPSGFWQGTAARWALLASGQTTMRKSSAGTKPTDVVIDFAA